MRRCAAGPVPRTGAVMAPGRWRPAGHCPIAAPRVAHRAPPHCTFVVDYNGTRGERASDDPRLGNGPHPLRASPRRALSGPNAATHDLSGGERVATARPLTAATVRRRISGVRGFTRRDDPRGQNRTEVQCPRATRAAMIAAAAFGLRRSGKFANGASGAAYWAASVRHGPPWPLPANASEAFLQAPRPNGLPAVRLPRGFLRSRADAGRSAS